MSKIIGIDLGTGNSCVAVVESGNATVITNAEGARTTPSIVGFSKDGERKVGDAAKRQAITNPNNTVHSVKRFIGCTEADCKEYIDKFAYTVECQNGLPVIKLEDKTITPQEISAAVLQKMKKTAEDYLGEEVTEAVITVPAYFNDGQRKATKEAGEIAGLTVRRIINEPTAAALAFGIDKMDKDMKVLVYDVGAGTADVSVLDMGDGVFEVLATNGDTFLGGDDIDNKIIDLLAEHGISEFGTDLRLDPMAHQRLKEAAEKAKIELSSALTTEINLPYITVVDSVPKHLVVTMSRAQLNGLIEDFTDKTLVLCKDVLKAADLSITDIDEILLVGGTTRIPYIQEKLTELFGKEPNKSVNPDEAVAIGAAIQGSVLAGEQTGIVLLDVTPLNLNITTMGQVATCMIEANTTIPTSKTQIFSTAADNQPAVDIEITQGNRPLAKDNKHLGVFILDGIIPAKRGVPQIEVTFELDANGILEVKATDKATGKEQNIRIEGSSGLSADEIERMRADAEAHADEDKKKMEFMELLNNVESTLMRTESSKESLKEKLTEEDEKAIDDAVANLKAVYEVEDPSTIDFDALKAANDAVNDVWNNIMVKLYSAQVGDDGSPVTVDGAPDGVNVTSVQVPEGVDPSKMSQEELQEMLNKMGINVNESGVVTPEE